MFNVENIVHHVLPVLDSNVFSLKVVGSEQYLKVRLLRRVQFLLKRYSEIGILFCIYTSI